MKFVMYLLGVLVPGVLLAVNPWPAESNTSALKLTSLDSEFTANMSGACWNPTNRTFWVCNNNPGIFWALVQNNAGNWRIATNAASQLRVVSLTEDGADVRIDWRTAGGRTNIVQAATVMGTNLFGNFSPALVITGSGEVVTNYLAAGEATNGPARHYRIRLLP